MPITVLDGNGNPQDIETPVSVGRKAATGSKPVVLSTEDKASLDALLTNAQLRAAAVPVSAASLPLPTGAATETGLGSIVSALGTVLSAITGATYYPVTQAISAASLPLPAGAATSAKQDSIVAAIAGATYFPATQPVSGTVAVSGSVAVTGTFWQATQPVSGTFWQATQPVSLASQPLPTGASTSAKQDEVTAAVNALTGTEYETVAASATNQTIGTTGATGDLLVSLLIIPATTSPGAVTIKDGAGAAITVFAGGASSVGTLHPFSVSLGIKSSSGAWQVSTGANVSAIAAGNFT